MPNYRRYLVPGGTYFFTVVTASRARILTSQNARSLLRSAFRLVRSESPFRLDAIVLLPEHLHAIWTLPPTDSDYSSRWGKIKKSFTQSYLAAGGHERTTSRGMQRQRRRGVWQPRFWEHMIRDETDYERHLDYIHYNPVKHGHVKCPKDWPYTSFHRWVRANVYPKDWGCWKDGILQFEDLDETAMEF